MDLNLFFRGLILGITIAAPVGPIGVLCMQRTLAGGHLYGFASGLGASTAHAIFASIAAFGLTFISTFLAQQQFWFRFIGGLFICYLGARVFLLVPAERTISVRGIGYMGASTSIFCLTLLNPITALFFIAIFPGFGKIGQDTNYALAGLLVTGVFAGSTLWWFILSSIASIFRERIGRSYLRWVNRISGVVIAIFGLMILLSLMRQRAL
jgi:threonine/homoserine/homoserine lactone efflux protein